MREWRAWWRASAASDCVCRRILGLCHRRASCLLRAQRRPSRSPRCTRAAAAASAWCVCMRNALQQAHTANCGTLRISVPLQAPEELILYELRPVAPTGVAPGTRVAAALRRSFSLAALEEMLREQGALAEARLCSRCSGDSFRALTRFVNDAGARESSRAGGCRSERARRRGAGSAAARAGARARAAYAGAGTTQQPCAAPQLRHRLTWLSASLARNVGGAGGAPVAAAVARAQSASGRAAAPGAECAAGAAARGRRGRSGLFVG